MDGNIYLINLVKKRPVLWNKSSKKVRDLEERNAAWKEIAAIIGVESTYSDFVRTRWYNLRERFVKELKLSYNDKQNNFKYYADLLFLAKQVEFRRKPFEIAAFLEQQLPDKIKNSFDSEFDFTEEMVEQTEPLEDECIFKELNNKSFEISNSTELIKAASDFTSNKCQSKNTASIEKPMSDEQTQSQITKCNLSIQKERTKLLNHDTITQEHRCEDVIFGELVTAILRKMSENKKKSVKKQIISILLE